MLSPSRSGTARILRRVPRACVSDRASQVAWCVLGDTAGGPVVVYLEVCDHEVPPVMSPVLQATRLRIVLI